MQLNSISAPRGARKVAKRVGRGIGSGLGKTCGRGHKGQHARSGGYHKVGFEGGQMPIQRRLPKFGFNSWRKLFSCEIRLSDLQKLSADKIDRAVLKESGLLRSADRFLKIIDSGKIERAVTVSGLKVTKGARAAIEAAGGKIEE